MITVLPQVLVVDAAGLITRVVFTMEALLQISEDEVTAGGSLFAIADHDGTPVDATTFKIEDGAFAPMDPEYEGDLPDLTVEQIELEPEE